MRRPWLLTTILALAYALLVVVVYNNTLALVTVGSRFSPEAYNYSEEGYDGQFVYFIARDPTHAADLIAAGGDFPAYRYQRILLPALGWMASLGGQAGLVPWALLIINLAALGGGIWVLQQLLHDYRIGQWYALGCGLSLAWLGAARLSLTEPLAYGLAIGGLLLAKRERWLWAAALFALAALAKETTLIVAAGVGVYLLRLLFSPQNKSASRTTQALSLHLIGFTLITLLPFVAWQLVLRAQFGEFGIGSGGRLATPFEFVPFGGVIKILTEGSPSIFLVLMLILLPFVLLPTVWGLWRVLRDRDNITLMTCVLFTTAIIMPFVPFSTYREPLGILRFIAGLQIGVIAYAAERRLGRPLRYSMLWGLTTLFVVMSDFGTG